MDDRLRRERRAAAHQGPAASRSLARALARSDRRLELRDLLALGQVEPESLAWLVELGEARGRVVRGQARGVTSELELLPGRRASGVHEVLPGVALVGAEATAWRAQPAYQAGQALLWRLGAPTLASARVTHFQGEALLAYRLRLASPWQLAPGYEVSAVRVFTLPGRLESGASKLRTRLLRSASALALVQSPEAPLDAALWRELQREYRQVHGRELAAAPLVLAELGENGVGASPPGELPRGLEGQVLDRVSLQITSRPGRPRAPAVCERISDEDGACELLALLLLGVARGASGLARPRPA